MQLEYTRWSLRCLVATGGYTAGPFLYKNHRMCPSVTLNTPDSYLDLGRAPSCHAMPLDYATPLCQPAPSRNTPHATPHHATQRNVTPHHATPRYTKPHHTTPRHSPRRAIPPQTAPWHHVASPRRHAMPRHATHPDPPHNTSAPHHIPPLTLPHPTPPRTTPPTPQLPTHLAIHPKRQLIYIPLLIPHSTSINSLRPASSRPTWPHPTQPAHRHKVKAVFGWVARHDAGFDFLLKTDMDTFICFSMITDKLDTLVNRFGTAAGIYLGHVDTCSRIQHNPTEKFFDPHYMKDIFHREDAPCYPPVPQWESNSQCASLLNCHAPLIFAPASAVHARPWIYPFARLGCPYCLYLELPQGLQ